MRDERNKPQSEAANEPVSNDADEQMPDPPRGNAADPTASVADDKAVNRWSVKPEDRDRVPDLNELHTVGMPDQEPRGKLGKTDPNLGQDTPLGGGEAEGRKKDAA